MAKENNNDNDDLARIRKLRQSKRDIDKEIRREQQAIKLKSQVDKWKDITDVKNKVFNTLKSAPATSGMSLKKILAMQDYYIYQNPKNTKQKATDKNADWVKDYLKKGGSEATLLDTANKSRPMAWKKMMGRKKTTTKKATDKKPTQGKIRIG